MKKLLSLFLALLLCLGMLSACGSGDQPGSSKESNAPDTGNEQGSQSGNQTPSAEDGFYFNQNSVVTLGSPAAPLNPQEVYDNLTYNHKMFYGNYRILGGEAGEEAFAKEMEQIPYPGEYSDTISAVPFQIIAGPHSMTHVIGMVKEKPFLCAYFYNGNGNLDYEYCAYTVSGNTITLNPVDDFKYIEEENRIRYVMTDVFLEYEFSFKGRELTLSDGKNSVTMRCGMEVYTDTPRIYVEHYASGTSDMLENAEKISMFWGTDYESRIYTDSEVPENNGYCSAHMSEDGLFTVTTPNGNTHQFVYFYCDNDGLILTDGDMTYYYNDDYSDRHGGSLYDNLTMEDMDKLDNMSEEDLEEIMEKKEDLLTDLAAAFENAGISVTVDQETGEITLDAAVLFPVNEYAVSQEGKELLKQFMAVYTGVVFDEKYDGFLSKIMVEGHTDSSGDYATNETLSLNRATSVLEFCLSEECQVDASYADALTDMLQAVGYASDKLIYDTEGNEDMAASRRVCFRFIINLE